MKRNTIACLAFLGLCFMCGCMKLGIDMIGAPTLSKITQKIGRTKSYQLALDGLPGDILMATAITELSPDNPVLLKECAYIYFAYGLFTEDRDIDYAKELYLTGKSYGIRALKHNKAFKKGIENNIPVHKLVDLLDAEYAPALCWTSLNAGLWVLLSLDDPASLMETADIIAMAKRAVLLDPNYFHGVVKALLGCYYAMVPKALDPACGPENSARMFRQAKAVDHGNMLLIDLFEARFLAANTNNQERFDSLLNHILETDSAALDDGYLYNELAKAKARFYLDHKEMFF